MRTWLDKELDSIKEGETYDYVLRRLQEHADKKKNEKKEDKSRCNVGFMMASGIL